MASYSGVQFQLRVFQAAHERFSQDGSLSAAGRQRALNGLANEIEAYKIQALDILSREWQYTKKRFHEIEAERDAAEQRESERWRYDKLAYEKETLTPEIAGARDGHELEQAFNKHAASGIVERKRALAELVIKYSPGKHGASGVMQRAEKLLAELTTSEEMIKLESTERAFMNRTVELYDVTQKVGEFYPNSRYDVMKLLGSLRLISRIDVLSMGYLHTLEDVEQQPA